MRLKKIFIFLLCIFTVSMVLSYVYSIFEYNNVKVKNIVIESKDIPESFNGMKIMYVADFQFDTKRVLNKKALDNVINIMNKNEKDIILLGGDFTNWEGKIIPFFKEFQKVEKPEYGIYTVTGNHDYANHELTLEELELSGIYNLDNKRTRIKKGKDSIVIAGVEDLWFGNPQAGVVLDGMEKEDFVVFLSHNPDYFEEMTEEEKGKADITLSGHIHAGMVSFFGLFSPFTGSVTAYGEKYRYGMKDYGGHKIYITSGVGGNALGQFVRFFAQPEVIILELKKV